MPVFNSDVGFKETPRTTEGATTQAEVAAATKFTSISDRGAFATIFGSAFGGVVDLADTLVSSDPIAGRGVKRGDVNQAVLNQAVDIFDAPGLRDFYQDTKEGTEVASAIYGVVAAEVVGRKLTLAGTPLVAGIRAIPYVRRIATLDRQYAEALVAVRQVDRSLAARGAIGVEQFVGEANIVSRAFSATSQAFKTTGKAIVRRDKVRLKALGLGAAVGGRNAARTEAIMAATLNENQFLYDDDASQNILWMSLGIGIGGGLDWLNGAYRMRKFVNSESVRRAHAAALDPEGLEGARLKFAGKDVKAADIHTTYLGGKHTDEVTSLLIGAKTLSDSPVSGPDASKLLANRDRLATQQMQLAMETVTKVTNKGITSNGLTRFTLKTPEAGNHLQMIMNQDPAALYKVEMLGTLPDGGSAQLLHDSHMARAKKRAEEFDSILLNGKQSDYDLETLRNMRKQMDEELTLTPQVFMDGEALPLSEAVNMEGFVEPIVKSVRLEKPVIVTTGKHKASNGKFIWDADSVAGKGRVSVDSEFTVHLPNKKTIDNADQFEVMRLYRVAQQAVRQMAKFSEPLVLPDNPTWFQLDMAQDLIRRSDGAASVQFPAGMTQESAQVESLVQKAEALLARENATPKQLAKEIPEGLAPEATASQLRLRYNLPKLTAYEQGLLGSGEHAVEKLLRGVGQYGPDRVRKMTLPEVKEAVAQIKRIDDIAPVTAKDQESLMGNSFDYMLDEAGQPIRPIFAYRRPFQQVEWSPHSLEESLAANKMLVTRTLTEAQTPLVRTISQAIESSPDLEEVTKVRELMDIQVQGSLAGSPQQGVTGAIGKSVITDEVRDRDNPILLAASRLRDTISRQTKAIVDRAVSETFGDSLNRLANLRNGASELLLNQYHSFRPGWDLSGKTVTRKGADGKNLHFDVLANTKENKERFKLMFEKDMQDGQVLLSPTGVEVALDDLALDIMGRIDVLSGLMLKETNSILRATGGGQVNRLFRYIPPPNTDGKLIGFVLGPDNKRVSGLGIVAKNQVDFDRQRTLIQTQVDKLGFGYRFASQDDIREFASIWDKADMDFINPGTRSRQAQQGGPRYSVRPRTKSQRLAGFVWTHSRPTTPN